MHIYAARSLGAFREGDMLFTDRLVGADIYFNKISVGATINAILLAVSAEGVSRIYRYAREPHVEALIAFLCLAGAKIKVLPECLEIVGRPLYSASARIIPDMIEAGTYLSLSLLTGADIKIKGADPNHLNSFFEHLAMGGAVVEYSKNEITATSDFSDYVEIETAPYPMFPTDLQPIIAPLLSRGGGLIREGVWKGRFGYLSALSRFGIKYEAGEGYAKIIQSEICCADAEATDLRGGAALLITALSAKGKSIIFKSEIIKRGYENIVNKLRIIGANIIEEQ
jgi:UDP-N-acetylglucosamine 1-carboxyvinyltransferase